MNWDFLALMMLMGHELLEAEKEGITDTKEQGRRAVDVRDAVLEIVGKRRFTQVLTDCAFDMETNDLETVLDRALEVSGYSETREQLFPS